MEWETRALLFFCSPFLVPCTGSVLHLRGGLVRQDGGCIMSWGGFTVRFTTSALSLCLSPLNVPLCSKAAKSLLTGKLWTHRELIRVSARLGICMWIGCGCIPGLLMSFTPQCLRLLSSETSHCHRCMSRRTLCMSLYTVRKSRINAARGVIFRWVTFQSLSRNSDCSILMCTLRKQELRLSFLHDLWCTTLFIPDWSVKIGQQLQQRRICFSVSSLRQNSFLLVYPYAVIWNGCCWGGGEWMLKERVNLMWKCRLRRIYPFEKRPFHLFCWFIP